MRGISRGHEGCRQRKGPARCDAVSSPFGGLCPFAVESSFDEGASLLPFRPLLMVVVRRYGHDDDDAFYGRVSLHYFIHEM